MISAVAGRSATGVACGSQRRRLAPAAATPTRRAVRLAVSAIAAPVEGEEALGSAALEEAWRAPAAVTTTSGRVVLESADELRSTWEHRAWVGGSTLLMTATLAEGLARVQGPGDAAGAAAVVLAAYFMADVGTAFYHWGVDNYGDGNTPVFGGQIAAFQGHHQR